MKKIEAKITEKLWGGRKVIKRFGIDVGRNAKIGEFAYLVREGFPILKIIEVCKPLSVQVHPSGECGKTEMWYVLYADLRTRVLGGIRKGVKKENIRPENIIRLMKSYRVMEGDMAFIRGGTVHTILPPAILLEVSQYSFVTHRLFDWRRKSKKENRVVDINTAKQHIKLANKVLIYRDRKRFGCKYFGLSWLKVEKETGLNVDAREILLFFWDGKGIVVDKHGEENYNPGTCIYTKDMVTIVPEKASIVFKITPPKKKETNYEEDRNI